MLQENISITNPPFMLPGFYDTDVDANQSDAQLLVAGSASADGYVMPKNGYVIALTGSLSEAASAGSLTVGVSIDGTEVAGTRQTITTATEIRALFGTDALVRFTAGQQVGVEISTSADWNGTAADLDAQVYVVFEDWVF
jgi:hypothetical protein